jgi:hypothetical protein
MTTQFIEDLGYVRDGDPVDGIQRWVHPAFKFLVAAARKGEPCAEPDSPSGPPEPSPLHSESTRPRKRSTGHRTSRP